MTALARWLAAAAVLALVSALCGSRRPGPAVADADRHLGARAGRPRYRAVRWRRVSARSPRPTRTCSCRARSSRPCTTTRPSSRPTTSTASTSAPPSRGRRRPGRHPAARRSTSTGSRRTTSLHCSTAYAVPDARAHRRQLHHVAAGSADRLAARRRADHAGVRAARRVRLPERRGRGRLPRPRAAPAARRPREGDRDWTRRRDRDPPDRRPATATRGRSSSAPTASSTRPTSATTCSTACGRGCSIPTTTSRRWSRTTAGSSSGSPTSARLSDTFTAGPGWFLDDLYVVPERRGPGHRPRTHRAGGSGWRGGRRRHVALDHRGRQRDGAEALRPDRDPGQLGRLRAEDDVRADAARDPLGRRRHPARPAAGRDGRGDRRGRGRGRGARHRRPGAGRSPGSRVVPIVELDDGTTLRFDPSTGAVSRDRRSRHRPRA